MSATTECKKWWMPEDFFLSLCSNRFEPEEGLASCPVCVTPRIQAVDTPCSPVILPDPLGTYILSVESPIEVTFNYPEMTNWQPAGSYLNFGAGPRSGYPTNLITYTAPPGPGYQFFWDFDLAEVWINPQIVSVDPVVMRRGMIQPGEVTTESGKSVCKWSVGPSVFHDPEWTVRASTETPTVDAEQHPQYYIQTTEQYDQLRVIQSVTYSARVTPVMGVPTWLEPDVEYRIDVEFYIQHVTGIGTDLTHPTVYGIRTGSSPWDYNLGHETISQYQFYPRAYTSRRYRFSTTDRADFMARTNFTLNRITPTTGYTPIETPHVLTTVASDDYIEAFSGQTPTFGGWSTSDPGFGGMNTKFAAASGMSTGWPDSIIVKRERVL